MDILLMLADLDSATGHSGGTDFLVAPDGALAALEGDPAGLIYAGAAIIHPRIFAGSAGRSRIRSTAISTRRLPLAACSA